MNNIIIRDLQEIKLLKKTATATKGALTRNKKIISKKDDVLNKIASLNNRIKLNEDRITNIKVTLRSAKRADKQYLKDQITEIKQLIKDDKTRIKLVNKNLLKITKAEADLVEYNIYTANQNAIIKQQTVIISADENANYTWMTHFVQLSQVARGAPNCLYIQRVEYYNEDGTITKNNDFVSHQYELFNVSMDTAHTIVINETEGGSDFGWKPTLWPSQNQDEDVYTKITTMAIPQLQINQVAPPQVFQEMNGKKSCVIDACMAYFKAQPENPKAKTMYNRLVKNYELYENGIHENDMEAFGQFINSSLNIIDFVNNKNVSYNKSGLPRFRIELINSKFNHVDLLIHNYDKPQLVSKTQYKQIKDKSAFYIDKLGKLTTIDGTYKLEDTDFKIAYKEWYDNNKVETLFIKDDDNAYKLVSEYHYNVHTFFKENVEANNDKYYEIDYKKAYYNYSNIKFNKYYKGLPSGAFINFKCSSEFSITDFNKTELIGFYHIEIKSIKSHEQHLLKLGFAIGTKHILTTSNIELLKEYVSFIFIDASIAPPVHIPFTDKLFQSYNSETNELTVDGKKDKSIRGYCKAFGLLFSEHAFCFEIKPMSADARYYQLINSENLTMYKLDNGTIKVCDKNVKPKRYKHLVFTIHGYLMTQMMELILSIDINRVAGIKLDSLIIEKDYKFKFDEKIFDNKVAKIEKMINNANTLDCAFSGSAFYGALKMDIHIDFDFKVLPMKDLRCIYKRVLFLGGKGGSGKTHSLLETEFLNLQNVCFATMCWDLVERQTKKHPELLGYSMPKLTGVCRDNNKETKSEKITNNNIKYIVLDEATLLNDKDIQQIIKDYPQCIIFIIGDIDEDDFYYQCSVNNCIFKPSKNKCQYVKYTTSYRFDNELNNHLDKLRLFMKTNYNTLYSRNNLFNYVKQEFNKLFYNKDDVVFNDNDIGISANNDFSKCDNEMTNYFISKGTKEQYYVKTTIFQKGLYRGRQLLEKPNNENYEMKLFKTIHSFQGSELSQDNKIIISIKSNFDYNLLYTSLSRAHRLNQIVILNK